MKNTNKLIKFLGVLWILLSGIIMTSCTNNEDKIEDLFNTHQYDKVLELSKNADLHNNDPSSYTRIAVSLVELGEQPDYLNDYKNISIARKSFIHAYICMLTGELTKAESIFSRLLKDNKEAIFGYVGLLELYLKIGDINNYNSILNKLIDYSAKSSDKIPSWIIPTYVALKSFYVNDLEYLQDWVNKHSKDIDPIVLVQLKTYLYLNKNDYNAAIRYLKEIPRKYNNNQYVMIEWMNINKHVKSNEEYFSILQKAYSKHSNLPEIVKIYAGELAEKDVERGIDIIRDLMMKRKWDIDVKLFYYEMLSDYKNYDVKNEIIQTMGNDANRTIYYNIVMAKVEVSNSDYNKAMKYVDKALSLNPNDKQVKWLEYIITKNTSGYDAAFKILSELYYTYDNDIEVKLELLDLCSELEYWGEYRKVEQSVLSKIKYLTSDDYDNFNVIRVQSYLKQKRIIEAVNTTKLIKDSRVKSDLNKTVKEYVEKNMQRPH